MYLHYSFHLFVSALFSFRLLLVFNFNTNFILDCENLGFFRRWLFWFVHFCFLMVVIFVSLKRSLCSCQEMCKQNHLWPICSQIYQKETSLSRRSYWRYWERNWNPEETWTSQHYKTAWSVWHRSNSCTVTRAVSILGLKF